jgi:FAD/FMN-containing dehydrogenase
MDALAAELGSITGSSQVITDVRVLAGYTTDWSRRYSGPARCAVRPGTTAEIAQVVAACARHGVGIIPQGGNTGLVAGGVPYQAAHERPPVILSTRRLRLLDPVDALSGQVTAGAGVTIAELRYHAARSGLEYGVNLASRDSATVGGTIATNAGGILKFRYGGTRAQVLGVEAVLADGSVISRLAGLETDSSGYELAQLLVGSEGTLGIITAARLRLSPAEPPILTLIAGVASVARAVELQATIRAAFPGAVRAIEYFEADGVALVRAHTGLPAPLPEPHPAYLLVELAGAPERSKEKTEEYAERLLLAPELEASSVALDERTRAALWAYRERHTEAISAAGIPHKLDLAMPVTELAPFRAGLDRVIAEHGARAIVFGHLGVGNLHVNVLGPDPADEAADEAVFRLVAAHGGTISAEHGIGRAKTRFLSLSRAPAEIAAMRAVKTALDPGGLFNPGVLFP